VIEGARRVLALSPHPDDAELGAGGTIRRLVDAGADVHIARFSDCAGSLGEEASQALIAESVNAASVLGAKGTHFGTFAVRYFQANRQVVLDWICKLRGDVQPDLVFVHSAGDRHQDHFVVRDEALRAFRCTVLGYETPWSNDRFRQQLLVRLTEEQIAAKVESCAVYKTQSGRAYMDPDVIRGLARVRGMQCSTRYAEAFEVLRAVE
jgi:LmbE family N-acetylglucosaminyl deacetylase